MQTSGKGDWVEERLNEAAFNTIPDDGFTKRVMARLPASRRASVRAHNAILIGFGALGYFLAAFLSPDIGPLILEVTGQFRYLFAQMSQNLTPILIVALALAGNYLYTKKVLA